MCFGTFFLSLYLVSFTQRCKVQGLESKSPAPYVYSTHEFSQLISLIVFWLKLGLLIVSWLKIGLFEMSKICTESITVDKHEMHAS